MSHMTQQSQFMLAIAQDNIQQIKSLDKANRELVNSVDEKGNPALFYAKTPDTLKTLLMLGANPDAADPAGNTKLHVIAASGLAHSSNPVREKQTANNFEMAKTLVSYGADPGVQNNQGASPEKILNLTISALSIEPNSYHDQFVKIANPYSLEPLNRKAADQEPVLGKKASYGM